MSEPTPPDITRIKVARRVNALLNQFVGVLDTKASMFLAGNVAAASFLLKDAPPNFWCRVIYFTAISAYAASVVMAGATIFPVTTPIDPVMVPGLATIASADIDT